MDHERGCGYARARCGLPRGKRDNDSCPLMVYRYEREEHMAQCPFRLTGCPVIGRVGTHSRVSLEWTTYWLSLIEPCFLQNDAVTSGIQPWS